MSVYSQKFKESESRRKEKESKSCKYVKWVLIVGLSILAFLVLLVAYSGGEGTKWEAELQKAIEGERA